MSRPYRATLTLLGLTIAACSQDPAGPSPIFRDDRPATLQATRSAAQRWGGAGLTSYRFRSQQSCFCPPETTAPAVVSVLDGTVASAFFADDGTPVARDQLSRYRTVDEVFAVIFEAIDQQAAFISVRYDDARGYPVELFIDESEMIADEELGLTLSELEPLAGAAGLP